MHSSKQFVLLDLFKRFNWLFLVLLMIMGGVAGYSFSLFHPKVYEARAVIAVTIDYTRTGSLSDFQEDQALRSLGSIIDADFMLKKTVEAAQEAGVKITNEQFKEKIALEREDFRWFLRVRDKNPKVAAELANIWADQVIAILTNASSHALNADYLQRYFDSLQSCLQRMANVDQAQVPCSFPYLEELLVELESTGTDIREEKEASLGLMPAVSFFLAGEASPPSSPALYYRNLLVFAGAFIGFLGAVLAMPVLRK